MQPEDPKPISNTSLSLGAYLRSIREKKMISIEQVASTTKIGVKLLYALESDSYSTLPAKPFVRGFIISYCRYLEIDTDEVLKHFDSFIDEKSSKKFERSSNTPHIFVDQDTSNESNKTILTLVMVGFLVIAIVVFVVIKPSLKHRKNRSKEKATVTNEELYTVVLPDPSVPDKSIAPKLVESTPVATNSPTISEKEKNKAPQEKAIPSLVPKIVETTKTKPLEAQKPADTQIKTPAAIPSNEVKHLLVIRSKADSWVKYQADDLVIKQFILKEGKLVFVRARNNIRFSSGNPSGIEISHDNKTFTPLPKALKSGSRTYVLPPDHDPAYKE